MTRDIALSQVPGDDDAAEALNAPLRRIEVVVGDLAEPDPAWALDTVVNTCLLYTSPSPRDQRGSRMPSSA